MTARSPSKTLSGLEGGGWFHAAFAATGIANRWIVDSNNMPSAVTITPSLPMQCALGSLATLAAGERELPSFVSFVTEPARGLGQRTIAARSTGYISP